jgi:hypothetical protein
VVLMVVLLGVGTWRWRWVRRHETDMSEVQGDEGGSRD